MPLLLHDEYDNRWRKDGIFVIFCNRWGGESFWPWVGKPFGPDWGILMALELF